jgi:hypothetical protein
VFQITPTQYAALDVDYRERFHGEVVRVIKENMPIVASVKSDDQLRKEVAAAHVRAEARGLTADADVANYALLAVCMGPEFDKEPRIAAFLDAPDGPGQGEKLEALLHGTAAKLRAGDGK